MSFISLTGQYELKKRLGAMFEGDPVQSLMFTGSEGVGKHLFAEETAKAMLCGNSDKNGACGSCPSCRYYDAGTHPDMIRIKAKGSKTIRVADLREQVSATVNIAPQISERKVYLVNADELNIEGQNLLLKSLEEPPIGVVFILITADASRILPTINSRVTEFKFANYSAEEIGSILKGHGEEELSEERILFLTDFSSGNPGKAITLMNDPDFINDREEMFSLIFEMPNLSLTDILYDRYSYFDDNRDRINELLSIMLWVFGDLCILLSTPASGSIKNTDKKKELMDFVSDNNHLIIQNISNASSAVNIFAKALKSNVNFEIGCCRMLLMIYKELRK